MKAKRLSALVLLLCLILAVGTSMMRSATAKTVTTPSTFLRANILDEPPLETDLDATESPLPITTSENILTASISDADWMAESDQISANLGYSVASAGDVNGDGYDDVIVGVPQYDYEQWTGAGAVFLWYGSPSGLGMAGNPLNADWKVLNNQGGQLGYSVGTAGDLDGDGYDDVIVGAPSFISGDVGNAGAVFIWYGSEEGLGGDGTPGGADWAAHGNAGGDQFGYVAGTAGDVNGDGFDDIIVGAPDHDNGQLYSAGAAFVWHGSDTGLGSTGTITSADWLVIGDQVNAGTGFSVSTAGDVNGDGFDDVIVGATGYDNDDFVFPGGAAFVWFGSESGLGPDGTLASADWMADGDKSDARYGVSVATTGDVNGDGYDDIIVGASGYDNDQIDRAGAAFVWYGSAAGLGDTGDSNNADWSVLGDQAIGSFGWSVGSAGDVNSDGFDDVIMGSHVYTNYQGICLVFNGSADGLLPRSLAWSVEPSEPMRLGFSVASAGDVNGDDAADVIMGAISYRDDEANEGAAFVFHGQKHPRFLLDISGPATAAPGQTVDYAIAFANFLTHTVDSAVLAMELPIGSEYVSSTAGGQYWPERHQVFWKLGDLAPGEAGQLSARGKFEWGLPLGSAANAYVKLAGSNWGQSTLDVYPYLTYLPKETLDLIPLSNQELINELALYPDMNTFYNEAIADGFILGGAAHVTITNDDPRVLVTLINEERSEILDISRTSEGIQTITFGPTFYAIQDMTGGQILDFQMGTLSSWGSWDSARSSFRTECSPTVSECITNFILDNVPIWFITNLSKTLSIALSSWDCLTGIAGNDTNLAKCFVALTKKKLLGELIDLDQAINKCEDDPLEYTCTDSKEYCDRDKTNLIVLAGFADSIKTLECDSNCAYKWPPTPRYSPQGQVCKECPSGPVFLPPDICCGGERCSNFSNQACKVNQESCLACDYLECKIQIAHDPNAKFGITGDVLPGQPLTYSVTYENEGTESAFGVNVVDELDKDLDDSTLSVFGGEYFSPTRALRWNVGELAPSDTGLVSFTVAISPGLPSGSVIVNEAVVHFPSVPEETPTNAVINVVYPVVAHPQHVKTTYAKPVTVTLTGADISNTPLTYAIEENPSFGYLSGSPPDLTYIPMTNFTGPDRFSFMVDNGFLESRPADVTIMVLPSSDDDVAPQVLWTSPGDNESFVLPAITSVVTDTAGPIYTPSLLVKFSEPLDVATMTAANLLVEHEGGGIIDITPVYGEWSNWLTIIIREPWQVGEYTTTLTTGVKDVSGNPLASDYTWRFSVITEEIGNNVYIPFIAK